ncbi:hypothetical protein A4A49_26976 [Nicotiana attenuata]|uniref:Uncharacterized protein n=1 Tax=Nicotiana attenuata TaxID=49451 RepID=A0A314KKG7_NICAT|nr:hypothetical protein A4A49_26976 [Nicotiana attenuata]
MAVALFGDCRRILTGEGEAATEKEQRWGVLSFWCSCYSISGLCVREWLALWLAGDDDRWLMGLVGYGVS